MAKPVIIRMLDILFVIGGFVILVYSADLFVNGASSLAVRLNIPTIVIGLTIVALGTSSPELAVNVVSSLHKTSDITIGNILGSNIINIALILGMASIVRPLEIKKNTTTIEIPLVFLSSLAVFVLGSDKLIDGGISVINRSDGLILLMFFSIFLVYNIIVALSGSNDDEHYEEYPLWRSLIYIAVGLGLLIFSGNLIVDSTVSIAEKMGISQRVISLTVVSLGTSLPELATSVVAAKKGKVDLAVGNVVGSNIFNVFLVLGVSTVIYPVYVNPDTLFDFIVNIIISILLYIFVFTGKGRKISKTEGIIFLAFYAVYLGFLIFKN